MYDEYCIETEFKSIRRMMLPIGSQRWIILGPNPEVSVFANASWSLAVADFGCRRLAAKTGRLLVDDFMVLPWGLSESIFRESLETRLVKGKFLAGTEVVGEYELTNGKGMAGLLTLRPWK